MVVLGISDAINAGASVIIDGKVVVAVNEERLVRIKMVTGFPRKAIAKSLELADLRPADVDRIGIAWQNNHFTKGYRENNGWFQAKRGFVRGSFIKYGSFLSKFRPQFPFLETAYYSIRSPIYKQRRHKIRNILSREFGFKAPVEFYDHHYCHATSAYYSSGFDDALVLTIDGGGDGLSATIWSVQDGQFNKLNHVSSFNSLGNYYAYVTHICGFKAAKHEGKITGLAAYGEQKYLKLLQSLIQYDDGTIVNVGNVFFRSAIEEILRLLPDNFNKADLAASIQRHTEEIVAKYVDFWRQRSGMSRIAMAGGVVANVKVNQRINELAGIDEVFVHPGMSDEGLGVGAALAATYHSSDSSPPRRRCFRHVYLGPEFNDAEIREVLEPHNFEFSYCDDIEKEIAKRLSEGYVVARFNGKMEYGPRALGNRSILYQATDPTVNDWLNKRLKRTEFMPFAPSTMIEHAEKCYQDFSSAEDTARFMTITFNCTEWMKKHCSGVVHIDGTARPQLVSASDNPSYYRILEEYYKLTGLPTFINTSFNIHEEPIVCTPSDALRAFQLGHLDFLAIGSYLVRNPKPIPREQIREFIKTESE
jgi:carbamoyltransferase